MERSSFIPNRTWLNKRSRAPAYTSQLVTVPAGYNSGPGHTCTGIRFGSEPGVAPAQPRVCGHTYKQGTTPTLAEHETVVHTVRRIDRDEVND